MKHLRIAALFVTLAAVGACANSAQEQRKAEQHQYNSDVAADQGRFGVAGDEQREAADSHHRAVSKAIDEGKPIPPQTERGGLNPDGGR